LLLTLAGCPVSGADAPGEIDLRDTILSRRDPGCDAYLGEYTATVQDLGRRLMFQSEVTIESTAEGCTISSNSIPNHDFNEGGSFATPVAEVREEFTVPIPAPSQTETPLSLRMDNGIFLNGVKLDQLAAACFGVGGEPLGQEKIGCFTEGVPWRYDPMHPANAFGTDGHNAHTQPDGAYHYHGDPRALYDDTGNSASGIVGFAADGFPIFGPYIERGGTIRRATSSYVLKSGARVSQSGEGAFPGGEYDGTFIDDWEYREGAGDLDECNGMTSEGVYGYYITTSYPWVIGCFRGTPHWSFEKQGP
jgi:hypothetical protein